MPKFKVTYNAKPKRTQQFEVDSFQSLTAAIYTIFNIENGKINFMKPRIKDQESFKKEVKEGSQLLITGAIKKQETPEEIERKRKQQEELNKIREELKLNQHQKINKRLKEKGIKERGMDYFNTETNQPEDLGVDYALCPLYLLKFAGEFKSYCIKYQCMQKNPDGLIIEQLGKIFRELENFESQKIVCPLEWISAWICYCSDDIEYPYPTYGIDYFLNRLFGTMKMAFDVELEKKQEEPNSRVDIGTKLFGIEQLTKRTDITKLDEDDTEAGKEIDKKAMKYFLECDLGKPEFDSLLKGCTERFKEKTLWRNFYAFDIQYRQKIIAIQRLPKYLFIHCSRWGYPPAHQEWQQVQFSLQKKSYHRVPIHRIIDLYDICDANLKDKLQQGRYERHQMFYPYDMDQRYTAFTDNLQYQNQYSDVEQKYLFFDSLLFSMDIYHEFFFEPIKNAKPTGQYRLTGLVLHRGDYYHRPDPSHNHNCKGEFMTIVYKRGKDWLKYVKGNVEVVTIDDATSEQYWGKEGGWTPVLLMYKEVNMKNMMLETPRDTRKEKNRK